MSNIPNKQHNFEIGYTPFNFFYSTNRQDFPKGIGGCSILEEEQKIGQLKCDDDSSIDKCYQLELCKNKDLVKDMYDKRNYNSTSTRGYDDLQIKYNYGILKSINLTAGIIGSILFARYLSKM
jgi:hypothetical protein|tara:strand:+ start:113 stop:481 length:369 start_codon:yes stop_codon:yes gene_type:complete